MSFEPLDFPRVLKDLNPQVVKQVLLSYTRDRALCFMVDTSNDSESLEYIPFFLYEKSCSMPHHIAVHLCGDTDAWCTSHADRST